MKKSLLILVSILLVSICAFGQKAQPKVVEVNKPVAKKPAEVFPREKFDPSRDPTVDLSAAVELAAKTGKRIVLDVGGEWCGWCVYMDKFFYLNPEIAKIRDENFIWIKVNYSPENENPTFLGAYPVAAGYPHLYVLDETGKLLQSQDTSPLEAGKGYDIVKFTEFLRVWSPKK